MDAAWSNFLFQVRLSMVCVDLYMYANNYVDVITTL